MFNGSWCLCCGGEDENAMFTVSLVDVTMANHNSHLWINAKDSQPLRINIFFIIVAFSKLYNL